MTEKRRISYEEYSEAIDRIAIQISDSGFKPSHIIFTNEDTKKHVVVKAEHTIKYIIREE